MSNSVRNAWVVTHVQPTGNDVGVSSPQSLGQTVSSMLGRFRVGHPKALGTVQIMIGVIILLIGIVMASSTRLDNVGVYSGIFVWGSFIFVIAGSLTVAADNHLNQCRVKGSLGMNVLATITAFMGIILFSLDTAGILQYYCVYFDCHEYWSRSQGLSAVLVILSLLEFIVSIFVSSFACKAVCQCCQCCHTPTQVIIVGEQISVPHVSTVTTNNTSFLPSYETLNNPKEPEGAGTSTGFQQYHPPPQYSYAFP